MASLLNFIKSNKNKLILTTFLTVLLILLSFYIYSNYIFNLKIEGERVVKLEYNEEYKEPGYKAFLYGEDLTKIVKVESDLDINKLGKYTIKYSVSKNGMVKERERIVEVVDTKSPNIKLKGETKRVICPNVEYQEEGYETIDNYDGVINDKVKVEIKDNLIFYRVKDKSNNKTEVVRELIRKDTINPEIILSGREEFYLSEGTKYVEPGYDVIDNCNGDLKPKVVVKSNVDESKVGTYQIEYSVEDESGNKTTKLRKVIVLAKGENIPSNTIGEIYLTFDDGPSNSITPKLLDILKEKNIKVTFFVIQHKNLEHIIKRAHDEGHVIALHSYSHNYSRIYANEEAFMDDFKKISDEVEKITGEKSYIFRFPGGSSNTVSRKYNKGVVSRIAKMMIEKGYVYFDWNVSSGDAGGAINSQQVYRNVVGNLNKKRPNVVLLHDFNNNYKTLNAISDIIDYGKKNGYEFKTINKSTPIVRHRIAN